MKGHMSKITFISLSCNFFFQAKSVVLDEVTMEAEKNLKEKLQLSKRLDEVTTQATRYITFVIFYWDKEKKQVK